MRWWWSVDGDRRRSVDRDGRRSEVVVECRWGREEE